MVNKLQAQLRRRTQKKMFLFKNQKKYEKTTVRESAEIAKAKKYLYRTHPVSKFFYGKEPYHYLSTSHKGKYTRYNFYKGIDKRFIYIVLSDEERIEVEQNFKVKMGEGYVYRDTIFSDILCDVVQHRFYIPNSSGDSRAYMTDTGVVGEGYLRKDD